jgi:dihydroorotate dehydrogenase (fumarate)
MVKRLDAAGADGVSLFNRFYEPDINIDSLNLQPSLHPSTSEEALMVMRWIAILHGRTELSLGATSGIHTAEDAIKLLLAGADVVHMASALLEHGPGHVRTVHRGILEWMELHSFESIDEVRGRVSQIAVPDPSELERANYVNVLDSYSFKPGVRV